MLVSEMSFALAIKHASRISRCFPYAKKKIMGKGWSEDDTPIKRNFCVGGGGSV